MVLVSQPFKVRLTEQPFSLAKGEKKTYGRFDLKRKYCVLGVYGREDFTDFLLADEDGVFHWVSSEICQRA